MKDKPSLHLLAFDLGAGSGRAMLGHFDDRSLQIEECYRFPNQPVRVGDHLYTDVLHLWTQVQTGLQQAAYKTQGSLTSVGVDTWGVDFALLDEQDRLLGNPHHYRDPHTRGTLEIVQEIVSLQDIYTQTGNQLIEFNTLFQLIALQRDQSPLLSSAQSLLMLPDLFNFWLCGEKASEATVASTSQCFNPITQNWATELVSVLGLPTHIFQKIVPAGTVLGTLRPWLAEGCDCAELPVIAPACHDTGSAVAAIPVDQDRFMYISSGTWSLIGVELKQPLINQATLAANFANEGGVGKRTRLLKITPGMWMLQQCRDDWARRGQAYSYDELTELARHAAPFGPLLAVGDEAFVAPGGMPARIVEYCQRTHQQTPQSPGEIVRTILESLALEYQNCMENLESLLGYPLDVIHIIGGGSRNSLLNQLTADLTQRPVIAGPVEATVAGNILVQLMALGTLASLDQARQVMRASFHPSAYLPASHSGWEDARGRYSKLVAQGG